MASLALLGAAVGFLAGASHSPVVAVLLPVLLALVGGASGFHISRLDLTSVANVAIVGLLGKSLLAFVAFFLVGSIYGISIRTGIGLTEFLPKLHSESPKHAQLPVLASPDVTQSIQLVLLRTRLSALGTSAEEQQRLLAEAATLISSSKAEGKGVERSGLDGRKARLSGAEIDELLRVLYRSSREEDIAWGSTEAGLTPLFSYPDFRW